MWRVEAARGYTSQDTGNTVREKLGGSLLCDWRGSAAISGLSDFWGQQRKLTRSCNTYGRPILCIREIHTSTGKHSGSQATKKTLPPGSAVGLSGRNSQCGYYHSPLCTSCISRSEVAPSSSGKVMKYIGFSTLNQVRIFLSQLGNPSSLKLNYTFFQISFSPFPCSLHNFKIEEKTYEY